jgi:hypothetical protein
MPGGTGSAAKCHLPCFDLRYPAIRCWRPKIVNEYENAGKRQRRQDALVSEILGVQLHRQSYLAEICPQARLNYYPRVRHLLFSRGTSESSSPIAHTRPEGTHCQRRGVLSLLARGELGRIVIVAHASKECRVELLAGQREGEEPLRESVDACISAGRQKSEAVLGIRSS